ncbi:septum formation initiator family protein [Candidatus Dependentiae bacterium]|nr:septum formation initiator family protein [Candidatus Dependentiae bacterium]
MKRILYKVGTKIGSSKAIDNALSKKGIMMVVVKHSIMRAFFVIEVFVFCLVYLLGTQGIVRVKQLQRENSKLEQEIILLKQEVNILEQEIISWQTNIFHKEKIAREQLQMARKNEQVYYIG